jgi:hypothetical protein
MAHYEVHEIDYTYTDAGLKPVRRLIVEGNLDQVRLHLGERAMHRDHQRLDKQSRAAEIKRTVEILRRGERDSEAWLAAIEKLDTFDPEELREVEPDIAELPRYADTPEAEELRKVAPRQARSA